MKNIITFFSGLIFGFGLIISGMANPAKVINFLNISGNWDPSLAFVMAGAVFVAYFSFKKAETKQVTLLNEPIYLPDTTRITFELLTGSFIFGSGWALAGLCPGPAIVALGAGYKEGLVFVITMIIGMLLHDYGYKKIKNRLHHG